MKYESGITAKSIIDRILTEVAADGGLCTAYLISIINEIEGQLYRSVICDIGVENATSSADGVLTTMCDKNAVESIFVGDTEALRGDISLISLLDGRAVYAICESGVKCGMASTEHRIYFRKLPTPKTLANYNSETIKLPSEYVSLIELRLRGEALKLYNEDELAEKWLAEYNARLDDFAEFAKLQNAPR